MFPYLEYLPDYLREFREYQAIGASTADALADSYAHTGQIYINRFIPQADKTIISRWEKILRITPAAGQSLADRRRVVIARFNSTQSNTRRRMEETISSITGMPCRIAVNFAAYSFAILFSENVLAIPSLDAVHDYVQEVKPANMLCTVLLQYAGASAPGLRLGGRQSVAVRVTVHPYVTPAITANPVLTAGGFLATGIKITV